METNQKRHMVDFLFVLTLLFLFAFFSMTLVVLGAQVYKSTISSTQEDFNTRTVSFYLTEKIRQYDTAGNVSVTTFGDGDAILLQQEIDGTTYNTYLYLYNGYITELFVADGNELSPESGQAILAAYAFEIEAVNDRLIQCSVTCPKQMPSTFYVSIHSIQEVSE